MPTVRQATPSDFDAVQETFRAASLWNTGDRDALLAHPEVLVFEDTAIVEGRVRVAVDDDGEVVGFATPRPVGEGVWELDDLFVAPRHMRRGFGPAPQLRLDVPLSSNVSGAARGATNSGPAAAPATSSGRADVTGSACRPRPRSSGAPRAAG